MISVNVTILIFGSDAGMYYNRWFVINTCIFEDFQKKEGNFNLIK